MRVILDPKVRLRMQAELTDELSPMLVKGHYTICNHLRLLYRTPLTDSQKELCEETMFLAKKMSKKLHTYKKGG